MDEMAETGRVDDADDGRSAGARAVPDGGAPIPPLAGVLFDLDGTLADTGPMWRHAYQRLAADRGIELEPGWWTRVVGRDLGDAAVALLGAAADAPAERRRAVDRLVDEAIVLVRTRDTTSVDRHRAGVRWRPGARRLLEDLRSREVPTAVVTATPRRLLDVMVDHLGIEVDVTVAGDEVHHPKPDPEGYLRAARLLGIEVEDCVAVEDSPTGVAAAEASGARVLAVPDSTAISEGPGRTVLHSLEEVTTSTLAALPRP